MQKREAVDAEVLVALQRIGVASSLQLHVELDDLTLEEVEASLDGLVAAGRVDRMDGAGRFFRARRLPVDWTRVAGNLALVHNDPVDILNDVRRTFSSHAGVVHLELESTFSALIGDAQVSLQIVSPYMDVRSVERFASEFAQAFSRHIEFTYVGRGILRREDLSQNFQYSEKVAALQRLWTIYNVHNPGDTTRFSLRDYLRYDLTTEGRIGESNGLSAAVHQKIVVQDHKRAYFGSGEFRNNSFGATGEIGILVEGDAADLLGDIVQCYARKGTPVNPLALEDLLPGVVG